MNICFCVDSLYSGGAERVVSNLANYFATDKSNKVSIIIVSSSLVESFYPLCSDVYLDSVCKDLKKRVKPFKRVKLLKNKILSIKPDVVLSFLPHINIYTHFALKGTGICHIVSERNDPSRLPKSFFQKKLRNYVFKKSSGCVFQTEDAANYFSSFVKSKSVIIPNPVFCNVRHSAEAEYRKAIVSVGRLVDQKNYCCALDAFSLFQKKHNDFIYEIYGDGEKKKELLQYIETNNIHNVVFLGNSKEWQIVSQSCFAFVLSSNFEGMPNSLMEAMGIGLPCISTNCPVGGPSSLIEDGKNGFLVQLNDSTSIFKTLEYLFQNPQKRIQVSLSNSEFQNNYSISSIGDKWLSFIKERCTKNEK